MRQHQQFSAQAPTRAASIADTVLLGCGIVYAASYIIGNDVVAAAMFGGYRRWDQAVSELSAKGADPRPLLVGMLPVWSALMVAFGVGIWRSAHGRRALAVTGGIMVAHGIVAIGWLWFPMTSRADMVANGTGSNDTGHLVMAGLTAVFVIAELVSASVAFGWWFRLYTLVSIVVIVACGVSTSTQSPNLENGTPTPWMGLYERVSIGCWLLWMTVLAVILLDELRRRPSQGATLAAPVG
jgi:hypothetical protein